MGTSRFGIGGLVLAGFCATACHAQVFVDGAGGDGGGSAEGAGEPGALCGAEVCATPKDESCDGEPHCTGEALWSHDSKPGEKPDGVHGESGARDIAVDPWDNVLVTGHFTVGLTVAGLTLADGEDAFNAFVLKLDPDGQGLWLRGGKGGCYGTTIGADAAGNVYVAGDFFDFADFGSGILSASDGSDVFVLKYDVNGNLLWSRGYGGPGLQWPTKMAVASDGHLTIVGRSYEGADFGSGSSPSQGETDVFVLSLDSAGEVAWSLPIGGAGMDSSMDVELAPGGDVVITGAFMDSLKVGEETLVSAGSDDVFVVRFSPTGDVRWARRGGGPEPDLGYALAIAPEGDTVLTGLYSNGADFGHGVLPETSVYGTFVARYGVDGSLLSSTGFGSAEGAVYATGAHVDGAGNLVWTGPMFGKIGFGGDPVTASGAGTIPVLDDVAVIKHSPEGKHVYSLRFGDTAEQRPAAITTDSRGALLLAGDFQGTIDFGTGVMSAPPPQGWDLFVAKLAP